MSIWWRAVDGAAAAANIRRWWLAAASSPFSPSSSGWTAQVATRGSAHAERASTRQLAVVVAAGLGTPWEGGATVSSSSSPSSSLQRRTDSSHPGMRASWVAGTAAPLVSIMRARYTTASAGTDEGPRRWTEGAGSRAPPTSPNLLKAWHDALAGTEQPRAIYNILTEAAGGRITEAAAEETVNAAGQDAAERVATEELTSERLYGQTQAARTEGETLHTRKLTQAQAGVETDAEEGTGFADTTTTEADEQTPEVNQMEVKGPPQRGRKRGGRRLRSTSRTKEESPKTQRQTQAEAEEEEDDEASGDAEGGGRRGLTADEWAHAISQPDWSKR